jgi:predicted CXXCH cytochrome family protein
LAVIVGISFFASSPKAPPPSVATAPAPVAAAAAVTPAAATTPASYVGTAVCKSCHEPEFTAWSGSHHDLAMQIASDSTVLGNFANAKFKINGIESSFFKRDNRFMVRTDGPDGKLTDYEISHTFGVYPLQQYLIPFPGGRYQVLPIAWDTRPQGDGGQRWFHLYPKQKPDPKDPLHWTGIYHNWALQCAECHSTDLRKGYDPASDTYKTTYSEINVACESCHGQGSNHVNWAGTAHAPYPVQGDKGLPVLKSRWHDAWAFPTADAKYALRDTPAAPAAMNTCVACHARRSTLSEDRKAGASLENTHRLALPIAPVYYVDGQQREEDYVWTSFLQSRMHQFGVTCMDCHDAHSQKLRTEGNALCTRCHNAAEFDAPKHHRHLAGGKGAQCVTCHMPTQNYMVIHARQDHSMRVPRPDLSLTLGSPNACTQCHVDRKPQWAASAMDKWYGKTWRDRPQFGTTLNKAETQGIKALPELLELANSTAQPGIVRATALTLARPYATAATLQTARALLKDGDPLVRIAALGMIEPADRANRILSVAPMLTDPIRGVRVEAARILADIPDSQIPEGKRAARAAALKEYEDSLALEADWPSGSVNLGNLRLLQGRADEAIVAFERAIARDRGLTGAYVNLADALRQQGREADAEKVLRQGLSNLPRDADLHHALGLLLTRKKERDAALKEFAEAAKLAPMNARFAYVQAIAVHSAGKRDEALKLLRSANRQHPENLDILGALISISREAGDRESTLRYARQFAALVPDNASVNKLIEELEAR